MLRRITTVRPLWIDVHGSSMGWSIPEGTKVRVELADRPRRGEVWVFCTDDGVVFVHRCRGEVVGGYRFQGDTRVRDDGIVPPEQLVGRVVEVSPARPRVWWGGLAGTMQRFPRAVVAWAVRAWRRLRRR